MSEYYKFVSESLENEIKNVVIQNTFPSLNLDHINLLTRYVVRLINIIALSFNYESGKSEIYMYQLKQNNYQDIKWLLTHLLPFLNNQNGELKNLTSLDEIYTKKKKDVNINSVEPKYVYSNVQYNRFIRKENSYIERQFTVNDLEQNFYLLVDSIKSTSHKMHVNWMDILPYTLESYEHEQLFINTKMVLSENRLTDWDPFVDINLQKSEGEVCRELFSKISGLGVEDIYNVISYDLFNEIKSIKWLIYDIPVSGDIFPVVSILKIFFELSLNLKQVEWEDINNEKFTLMWNRFIQASDAGNNIVYKRYNISSESLKKMMKGILYSFDKNKSSPSRRYAEELGYIPIPQDEIKELREIIDDEEDDLPFTLLMPSLKSIPPQIVYEFITESLQKFKGTWYGTKLLTNDKKDVDDFTYFFRGDSKIPITYKNIYNFAKSMVNHVVIQNGKELFVRYPDNWKSLNPLQKKDVIRRLNNEYDNWFNIKGYIRRLYSQIIWVKVVNEDAFNQEIHKNIMDKLVSIVFETMITKGVLTKFVPDRTKTNRAYLQRDLIYTTQEKTFETTNENEYWTSAYHYLTCVPYKQMDSFNLKIDGKKTNFNYFTWGKFKNSSPWYAIDAYNWVAQIGFCHHFLNNRVIFITGSTGVGKSTEVPKLFLYYTKALDYVQNAKLICTEPRTGPARENADYISKGLGLPISETENNIDVSSKHYYIQTKFKAEDSHSKYVSHAMLQYATDGTLILEANNPVMKDKYVTNRTSVPEEYKFTDSNCYDVIMIDEAHEHKINMDLLLTIFKHATSYNNTIRLVIISATMDDDEPKYRRFFRDINDNKKYPLNTWLRDSNLDRINVDRRYHISPPGVGTRYKVAEHYEPMKQELDIVLDILNKSDSGDILVFEPDAKGIVQLMTKLNSIIPSNVVAFPYFGAMDEEKKKFIGKISNKLKDYKLDKSINFADPSVSVTSVSNGNNQYTRAVIVATNIAEASITIETLKFVVDTGTQKTDTYNYKKRGNVMKKIYIAESNRIQRKGRVGRKSSGDVYYLYRKGLLEENTVDYEISTKNMVIEIFRSLKTNDEEQEIIPEIYDPNKFSTSVSYDNIKDVYGKFGLDKMILNQYFLESKYYDYYGNDDDYDYINYKNLEPFYNTGFGFHTLTDKKGEFYLIHPNELDIKRNIAGDIVGKKNEESEEIVFTKDKKYKGYILSKKIRSFWQMMLDYLYISFNTNKNDIIKTKIGTEIIQLFETLQIDVQYYGLIRALVFGIAIGCNDDIFKLVSFYMSVNMMPTKIKKQNTKLYSANGCTDSDSKIILGHLNDFHKYMEQIQIKDNSNLINKLFTKIPEVSKYKLTRNELNLLLGPEDTHTKELNEKISSAEKKSIIIGNIEKFVYSNIAYTIRENAQKIIGWCDVRHLDANVLVNYLVEYYNFKSKFNRKMTAKKTSFIQELKANFSKTSVFSERNLDLVDVAIVFGFPFNICKKVSESSYYLSMYNPNLDNIYKIQSTSKYKFKPNILMEPSNLSNYLLYFKLDIDPDDDDDTMICLHKVDPKLFTILSHIYNKKQIVRITHNENIMNKIDNLIKSKISDKTSDLSKMMINYTKTLTEMEKDLTEFNNKKTIIKNLDIQLETYIK